MRALATDKQPSAAHAQRAPCIFQQPHLSSLHKAAHDAHKDAPHATPHSCLVCIRTGRRGDESVSSGEHAAPQKALQLQRRKLQLHKAGKGRQCLVRALRMDPHRSAHSSLNHPMANTTIRTRHPCRFKLYRMAGWYYAQPSSCYECNP
jgi:hypothetical protein